MIWTSCFWSDLRGMVNLSYMIFQCWLQGSNSLRTSYVLWHRFGGGRIWRRSWEELPLLARWDIPSMPGHATNDLPGVAVFPPPDELAPHRESARDHQQLIYTICLDTGPKDWSVILAHGHRCTWYDCDRRSVFGYLTKELVFVYLFGCMVTLCLARYVLQTMYLIHVHYVGGASFYRRS
jgi:hypothetical protein